MADESALVNIPFAKIERLLERIAEQQAHPVAVTIPGTDVPLLTHIERILMEHQRAVDRTAANLEYRLDILNHWRSESLNDRELFLQKNVYEQMHANLTHRVEAVERIQSRLQGMGLIFIALAAVGGAVVAHLLSL